MRGGLRLRQLRVLSRSHQSLVAAYLHHPGTVNVARYLSGQPGPPVTFVPAVMITKANAAEVAGAFLSK